MSAIEAPARPALAAADLAESVARGRALLRERRGPDAFRRALLGVNSGQRDAWVDAVLEVEPPPDDGPELPRGCVPYLPCSVEVLLRMVEVAPVRGSDVLVDVGAGVGRAAVLGHLLSGAVTIGLEIQPALVRSARALATRLGLSEVSFLEGDAAALAPEQSSGSVFFLYCPFSGERLSRLLDGLEPLAATRALRVCCVDLPLPERSWLAPGATSSSDLTVFRSTLLDPV